MLMPETDVVLQTVLPDGAGMTLEAKVCDWLGACTSMAAPDDVNIYMPITPLVRLAKNTLRCDRQGRLAALVDTAGVSPLLSSCQASASMFSLAKISPPPLYAPPCSPKRLCYVRNRPSPFWTACSRPTCRAVG